jgi:hypothetical protein
MSRFIEWSLIAFGTAYVVALCVGLFLVGRSLVRRWRALWRPRRGRVGIELLGTAVVLGTWYLASRIVP